MNAKKSETVAQNATAKASRMRNRPRPARLPQFGESRDYRDKRRCWAEVRQPKRTGLAAQVSVSRMNEDYVGLYVDQSPVRPGLATRFGGGASAELANQSRDGAHELGCGAHETPPNVEKSPEELDPTESQKALKSIKENSKYSNNIFQNIRIIYRLFRIYE